MRNHLEDGESRISIFTPTLTENNKKENKKPNMIIQATKTKAHTKALKVILEGRMQENSIQQYLLLNNLPFQISKTSLLTNADTRLNLCYPISYSAALL